MSELLCEIPVRAEESTCLHCREAEQAAMEWGLRTAQKAERSLQDGGGRWEIDKGKCWIIPCCGCSDALHS